MRVEEIREKIQRGIPDCEVFVEGDGRHFQAIVVSDTFTGKNMVQQHQQVYQTLGDKVGGEIHALSLTTYTSDQWQKKRSQGI